MDLYFESEWINGRTRTRVALETWGCIPGRSNNDPSPEERTQTHSMQINIIVVIYFI